MIAKPKSQIKTTGEMREFLVNLMVGVKDGHVDLGKASNITKLAGQVNESIYAEIKASRLQLDVENSILPMGSMEIGSHEVG